MKKKIHALFGEWQRFMTLERRFNEKITFFIALKATIISISYTLIIIAVPVALLINLFIFDALKYGIIVALVTLVFISVRLYYVFYHKKIVIFHPSIETLNLTFMFKVERILIYSVLIAFGLIILGALL